MSLVSRLTALGVALALGAAGCSGDDQRELLVAAASDLQPVLAELAATFEAEQDVQVTVSIGSTGQLAQQVVGGAPFDLFLAADTAAIDQVVDADRGDPATRQVYARGRLSVWTRDGPAVDLTALPERDGAVAIANPEHAPYGVAAREALEHAGVADALEGRLLLAASVVDAHRLARSGEAEAAVTARSLAVADGDPDRWTPVAADHHAPITQEAIVTASDADRARLAERFAAALTAPEGRALLTDLGFDLPG